MSHSLKTAALSLFLVCYLCYSRFSYVSYCLYWIFEVVITFVAYYKSKNRKDSKYMEEISYMKREIIKLDPKDFKRCSNIYGKHSDDVLTKKNYKDLREIYSFIFYCKVREFAIDC